MSRQYFADIISEPPTLNMSAALVGTTEEVLVPTLFTPINIGDIRAGKVYQLKAGGIWSTAATGALTITPRLGLAIGGITLGASVARTVPASVSGVPWYLQFTLVVRSVSQLITGSANSVCIGNGCFWGSGLAAGPEVALPFGGAVCTFDSTIAQGLWIGKTLSVAGSITPEWCTWQSLN